MSNAEVDRYLESKRTCRIATTNQDGSPHLSALWFVWDGQSLWLFSLIRSQRWANLMRNPTVAVLVDDGEEYSQLRGVSLVGEVSVLGDIPRTDLFAGELQKPEELFSLKYSSGTFTPDGKHAWLRLVPKDIKSWDFSKIPPI